MSRALVIGSEGQDGRILFERLRSEGSEVVGLDRGVVRGGPESALRDADVLDSESIARLVGDFRPDAIYYLAAVHHSAEEQASLGGLELYAPSHRVHVEGLLNVLEAVRRRRPEARVFYAASCLVFGEPPPGRQDEATPLRPVCVYGITKAAAVHCCRLYRARYGLHVSAGILYNHESPLRRPEFVSQRIVRGAVEIRRGRRSQLVLGDLSAVNDWGWAPDTVDAMVRMTRLERAEDLVVATGEAHTVAEFVRAVFAHAGLEWERHVVEDPARISRRRSGLVGNPARLMSLTGWRPTVGFEEMAGRLWEAAWNSPAD